MHTELITTLAEWIQKNVVIVADTVNQSGKKVKAMYQGKLIRAEHQPLNPTVLFPTDEIVIQTNDMILEWIDSYIAIPIESIEQIEISSTEVQITKTNGFIVTVTLIESAGDD